MSLLGSLLPLNDRLAAAGRRKDIPEDESDAYTCAVIASAVARVDGPVNAGLQDRAETMVEERTPALSRAHLGRDHQGTED